MSALSSSPAIRSKRSRLAKPDRPRRSWSILWVDLDRPGPTGLRGRRGPEARIARPGAVREATTEPFFGEFGSYLHVVASRRLEDGDARSWSRWLSRRRPVGRDGARDARGGARRVSGVEPRDPGCRALDGPEFLAALLEWVLAGTSSHSRQSSVALEEFDTKAMTGDTTRPRRSWSDSSSYAARSGDLGRALVSHREMFFALTHPESTR